MRFRTFAPAVALLALLSPAHLGAAPAAGFRPTQGLVAEDLELQADIVATAPDGAFATAHAGAAGATLTVYNHAEPSGRRVVAQHVVPVLRYIGGMAFAAPDTLIVSENGMQSTVFAVNTRTGAVAPLAPAGSIPNVAQVRVRPTDGAIFAVAANRPGSGAVYRIAEGRAIPFAAGLGNGYLGGIAFDRAGNVYVGDSNDPNFTGAAGRILGISAEGRPFGAVSLAAGRGSGVYDVTADRQGALYATTGGTVTRVCGGRATALGAFSGFYPFPTDIAIDANGGVIVNGGFTAVGGLFRIRASRTSRQPNPLP